MLHLIKKPILWFAQQNKWLVSIWNAILVWCELSNIAWKIVYIESKFDLLYLTFISHLKILLQTLGKKLIWYPSLHRARLTQRSRYVLNQNFANLNQTPLAPFCLISFQEEWNRENDTLFNNNQWWGLETLKLLFYCNCFSALP